MLDRRAALKAIAAATAAAATPALAHAQPAAHSANFGWAPNKLHQQIYQKTRRRPFLSQHLTPIKGTGRGKKASLHLALEKVSKETYTPHDQTAPDCVGQAFALGVDVLAAVQIAVKRYPEWWIAKAAPEPIYGGSRVEIGGETRGRGSQGHWAADWLTRYGVLLRKKYPGHDFTTYSGSKSDEYGRTGVPDDLEPYAQKHPVRKTAICRTYSELCDSIYNGFPVVVCSNVGFGNTNRTLFRDDEGFLTRSRWFDWWHAMLFAAYDDAYDRPGALCFNSWGPDWVKGPTRGNQPASTFWVDADTVDLMLGQEDSFSLSTYVGFPRVNIPDYVLH